MISAGPDIISVVLLFSSKKSGIMTHYYNVVPKPEIRLQYKSGNGCGSFKAFPLSLALSHLCKKKNNVPVISNK